MTIRRSAVDDAITNLFDLIESQRDPVVRLGHYAYALDRCRSALVAGRNAAAYEARNIASIEDIADAALVQRREVSAWSIRHAELNALPAPRRSDRADLSHAIEILIREGVRRPVYRKKRPPRTDENRD